MQEAQMKLDLCKLIDRACKFIFHFDPRAGRID